MCIRSSFVALAVLAATSAFAQQGPNTFAESPHTFTGNVGLFSDYLYRGVSQTYRRPALQGGFDYGHASGWYAGIWGSSVSGNLYPNGAGLELDFYGGYKFEPVKDLGLDLGLLHYYYPGARYYNATQGKSGYDFANTELYAGATYQWLSVKYSRAIIDYFGINNATFGGFCGFNPNGTVPPAGCIGANPGGSKGTAYLDMNANFEIAEKTVLVLHAGRLSVKNYGQLSYTDYKVGITRDFGFATLGAALATTNARDRFYRYGPPGLFATPQGTTENKDPGDSTLLLSIQRTF